jgi:hypothetical protein
MLRVVKQNDKMFYCYAGYYKMTVVMLNVLAVIYIALQMLQSILDLCQIWQQLIPVLTKLAHLIAKKYFVV